MLYINTRTGLIFDASSEISGDEIELYETEPVEKPKKGRKKNS